MNGRNEIILCPAEMGRAVQHYFDTVLFREGAAPKVSNVTVTTGGGTYPPSFRVEVTTRDQPPPPAGEG